MNKILKINLAILIIIWVVLTIIALYQETGHGYFNGGILFYALVIALMVGINLFMSLANLVVKEYENSKYYFFASLLILTVGFSTCFGTGSLITLFKK